MSNGDKKNIAVQLDSLQKIFSEQLPERLKQIQELWATAQQQPEPITTLHELHLKVHSLSGSGGTFVAMQISKAAKALDDACKEHIDKKLPFNDESQLFIQKHMDKLNKIAAEWEPTDIPYIEQEEHSQYTKEFNNLIYIVDDDVILAKEITTIIENVGYQVRQFNALAELQVACNGSILPGIILIDMDFNEGTIAGAQVVQKLRHECENMPPVIFMSVRNDVEARLAAVKAGASRYFFKPLDFKKLIQTIDGLTGRLVTTSYRVLIVDDDEDVLNYHATLLRSANIEVETLMDPMQVLSRMDSFQPELLLLDVYMPLCSGLELASMIRQDDKWSQLPIVFLSSEADLGRQLAAMNLGGDDFLTKPVDSEHLIIAVRAKLKRSKLVTRLNRELRETLKQSEYQRIALDQHGIVSITNPQSIITSTNDKFCKVSGYTEEELIGQKHSIVSSNFHPKEYFIQMWETIRQGKVWHGEICNQSKTGNEYWIDSTIVPFLDDDGVPYQYVEVATNISEIKEAQSQLLIAKEEAENSNRAKSEFLSNMSHELRTPLNAILGFSQLLKIDKATPLIGLQLKSVNEIEKGGNHLLSLINEILDLARIEAGRVELSIEAICFKDLKEECIALISPLLTKYQVEWGSINDSCESTIVRADYTRLKQVLLNLLSNACKYNKPGGHITIECRVVAGDQIRIMVIDSGEGIPDEKINELYKPFNRLGAENSDIEGTGIGLVMTKQLVELMGGTVGVESEVGTGSNFWLELPQDRISSVEKIIANDIETDDSKNVATQENMSSILYIEDNPANLRLVTQLLGHLSNIVLRSAHEPFLGLELAETRLPDLILLDINLPGMDGYQVLQHLQTNEKTKNVPVIAVSASAMQRDIDKGLEAGFTEYLTKPINVEKFFSSINRVLSKDNE